MPVANNTYLSKIINLGVIELHLYNRYSIYDIILFFLIGISKHYKFVVFTYLFEETFFSLKNLLAESLPLDHTKLHLDFHNNIPEDDTSSLSRRSKNEYS